MPAPTATDADPRAPGVEARLRHLEERTSRLTGALWLLLDAQFAVVNRLGALSGDPAAFKRTCATRCWSWTG